MSSDPLHSSARRALPSPHRNLCLLCYPSVILCLPLSATRMIFSVFLLPRQPSPSTFSACSRGARTLTLLRERSMHSKCHNMIIKTTETEFVSSPVTKSPVSKMRTY
eukprot:2385688-Rhodomonas_salina.2